MKDVVVLMSGGLDSTVLCHMAGHRLRAVVFCDFGQPAARRERMAVESWSTAHGIDPLWLSVPMIGSMATGAGEPGPRVLPGRNLVMLSMAINACLVFWPEVGELWFGAIADDYEDYPDCRPQFVGNLNHALAAGRTSKLRVDAPLIWSTKAQVVAKARDLGVDVDATWSCYEPFDGGPCGGCNSCRSRDGALGLGKGVQS